MGNIIVFAALGAMDLEAVVFWGDDVLGLGSSLAKSGNASGWLVIS